MKRDFNLVARGCKFGDAYLRLKPILSILLQLLKREQISVRSGALSVLFDTIF